MTPLLIGVLVLLSLLGAALLGGIIVLTVETARRVARETGNPLAELERLHRLATRADGEDRK